MYAKCSYVHLFAESLCTVHLAVVVEMYDMLHVYVCLCLCFGVSCICMHFSFYLVEYSIIYFHISLILGAV